MLASRLPTKTGQVHTRKQAGTPYKLDQPHGLTSSGRGLSSCDRFSCLHRSAVEAANQNDESLNASRLLPLGLG
jgi:hypothetical protein